MPASVSRPSATRNDPDSKAPAVDAMPASGAMPAGGYPQGGPLTALIVAWKRETAGRWTTISHDESRPAAQPQPQSPVPAIIPDPERLPGRRQFSSTSGSSPGRAQSLSESQPRTDYKGLAVLGDVEVPRFPELRPDAPRLRLPSHSARRCHRTGRLRAAFARVSIRRGGPQSVSAAAWSSIASIQLRRLRTKRSATCVTPVHTIRTLVSGCRRRNPALPPPRCRLGRETHHHPHPWWPAEIEPADSDAGAARFFVTTQVRPWMAT